MSNDASQTNGRLYNSFFVVIETKCHIWIRKRQSKDALDEASIPESESEMFIGTLFQNFGQSIAKQDKRKGKQRKKKNTRAFCFPENHAKDSSSLQRI